MKIVLCGSHSTGKTTLLHACKDKWHNVTFIEEVARDVIALGMPLNQNATVEAYSCYIAKQLCAERTAATPNIISDRCLMDILAYMYANCAPGIPEWFERMMKELVRCEARFFDTVCYFPIEFELTLDGVRPMDREYRLLVDRQYDRIFEACEIDPIVVRGPHSNRLSIISRLMGEH